MDSILDFSREVETGAQLASIVKRLGNPVSTILLSSSCHIFSMPIVDGVIGYQLFKNCAVVIGDPVCLPEDFDRLTGAFHEYCQKSSWSIIYLLVSESFAHWAIDKRCHTLIEVGEELILDPSCFQKRQKLRWKINQSLHSGVVIREYQNPDPVLDSQIQNTVQTWLKGRHGPQIYLGKNNLFVKNAENRVFYALQEERMIGLLSLSPVDQFQGWVVTSYMAISDAPVGVTEHLMSVAIDKLAAERCHFLCIGCVAGSKLGSSTGLSKFALFFARFIFKITNWFFCLDARRIYLNKYHPSSQPTYVLFSQKLKLRELLALKEALNV